MKIVFFYSYVSLPEGKMDDNVMGYPYELETSVYLFYDQNLVKKPLNEHGKHPAYPAYAGRHIWTLNELWAPILAPLKISAQVNTTVQPMQQHALGWWEVSSWNNIVPSLKMLLIAILLAYLFHKSGGHILLIYGLYFIIISWYFMENPIKNWWFDGISWKIPLKMDDFMVFHGKSH